MMLKIFHCLIVLLITIAGAGQGWTETKTEKQKPSETATSVSATPVTATPVTATSVTRDTVIITEEAMGWIEAKINPTVAAEVSGRIQKVYVDTGQVVNAGDTMVTIDSEQQELEKAALQSDVDRLEALIVNQKRTLDRYQNLLSKKSISQERFDNADVKLITLKEQLAGAISRLADNRRRLAKTSVFAPVGGWVEKRFVSEGDFVRPGTPLLQMVTDQFFRIVLPFPENVASKLCPGLEVQLTSPLSQNRIINAKIDQIRPAVNIYSRALEVIIYLENPGAWRPGGTINGTVIIERRENGILVPAQALVRRPAGEVVYQIENRIVRQRQVITGQSQGDLVEIISGLKGDERIVVDGAGFLTDGAPVMERQQ
ncbi:MAG: efflux RND transporter periplasmic adaptor subunit [Deltaproteobacteria bacterium]|nr:efflux RND transporter periplasmic adaptor subunit [Candidatus Tharpella aukensis]